MESKDTAQHESYNKHIPLQVDASAFIRRVEDGSTHSSPSSAATSNSPHIPLVNRPSSRGSESADLDEDKEPASGPDRARSASSAKSDREKRKRSRVTPEQLVHLECFFSVDRSPTAARRREISELLGMQERQTQIWFQNRRAKAKLQDGKHKGRSGSAETPPDTPPELITGFEADLHNLIHEDEPVTIIPCTDLSIGTWRRIATTVGKHDLVAYVCDTKRCITWFIHSGGYGFKMEIPFNTIVDTEFTNAAPGSGLASFLLSQPPIFYLENISSPRPDGSTTRQWKRCSDWTEGHQATHVLRHDLIGSAVQLAHVLRNLHTNAAGSDIPLHSPSYRAEPPPASPMELPLPPMAGLSGPGYHYPNGSLSSPAPDRLGLSRKRSYTGPGMISQSSDPGYSSDRDLRPPPHSAPAGSFAHSYGVQQGRGASASSNYGGPMYGEYQDDSHIPLSQPGQSITDYNGVPISHGLAPRPYSAQPASRSYHNDIPRGIPPYQNESLRRPHSSDSLSHPYHSSSPSPPILTTPYHPPPHLTENMSRGEGHAEHLSSASPPMMSGLPGLMYESDERRDR